MSLQGGNESKLNAQQGPPPIVRVMKMVWAFFLASQVGYYYISTVTAGNGTTPLDDPTLLRAMSVSALLMLVGAVIVPKLLWSSTKKRGRPLGTHLPDRLPAGSGPLILRFLPFLVRLVFFESCAVIGFVLAFIQHDPNQMLPYLAGSMIGLVLNFPTPENLLSRFP